MIRMTTAIIVALVLVAFASLGWRGRRFTLPPIDFWHDMTDQPRYNAQEYSPFFADDRVQRRPPAGAVPWGYESWSPAPRFAVADATRFSLASLPIPIDRPLLTRGRLIFDRHCAVCHGRTGEGNGITTRYGMNPPPTYHSDRLREETDGYIYQVITEGRNTMGPYGGRIAPDDRWAIVAHVRVLQRAFHATLADVPESERATLEEATTP